eukprot:m.229915 g.229915  ORF g.229915 m.229915 type:complete len:1684 (-) comp17350_c0_seq1:104-5155(-)
MSREPAIGKVRDVRIRRITGSFGIDLDHEDAQVVSTVAPGRPAEVAGLFPGDRIITINNRTMHKHSRGSILKLIADSGSNVDLGVVYDPMRLEELNSSRTSHGSPTTDVPVARGPKVTGRQSKTRPRRSSNKDSIGLRSPVGPDTSFQVAYLGACAVLNPPKGRNQWSFLHVSYQLHELATAHQNHAYRSSLFQNPYQYLATHLSEQPLSHTRSPAAPSPSRLRHHAAPKPGADKIAMLEEFEYSNPDTWSTFYLGHLNLNTDTATFASRFGRHRPLFQLAAVQFAEITHYNHSQFVVVTRTPSGDFLAHLFEGDGRQIVPAISGLARAHSPKRSVHRPVSTHLPPAYPGPSNNSSTASTPSFTSPNGTPPTARRGSAPTAKVRRRQGTPYRQPLSKVAQAPNSTLKAGPRRASSQLATSSASSSNASLNTTRRRSNGSATSSAGLNVTRRLEDLEDPDTPILDGMQAPPVRRPITARSDSSHNLANSQGTGSAVHLDPSLTLSAVKRSPKRNDQAARRLARFGGASADNLLSGPSQGEEADASVVLDELPGLLPVPLDLSVEGGDGNPAIVTPLRRLEQDKTPSPTEWDADQSTRDTEAAIMAEGNVSLAELLYDPSLDSSTCLELVQGMEDWDKLSVSHPEGSGIVGEQTSGVLSEQVLVGSGSFGDRPVWTVSFEPPLLRRMPSLSKAMPGGSLREALAATAQMRHDLEATLMPFKRIVVLPPKDLSCLMSPTVKLLYSSPAHAMPLSTLLQVQRSGARSQGLPLNLSAAADRNRVCVALASAVSALHSRRVGHGALSPHMVAVSPSGDVCVMGYGCPLLMVQSTFDVSSARYAAPEVLHNPASVTPAADVFSLGVMVAEIANLGHHYLAEAVTREEVLQRVLTEKACPTRPQNIHADLELTWAAEPAQRCTADTVHIMLVNFDDDSSSEEESEALDRALESYTQSNRTSLYLSADAAQLDDLDDLLSNNSNSGSQYGTPPDTPNAVGATSPSAAVDEAPPTPTNPVEEDHHTGRAAQLGEWIPLTLDTPLRNASADSLDLPPLLPNTTEVASSGVSSRRASEPTQADAPAVMLRLPSVSEEVCEEPLTNGHAQETATAVEPTAGLFTAVEEDSTVPEKQQPAPTAPIDEPTPAAPVEDDDEDDFFAMLRNHVKEKTEQDAAWRPEQECDLDLTQLEDVGNPTTWKQHFNVLLQDEQGMVCFEKFMKTLHCEDNAQFFRDVESLRNANEAMQPIEIQRIFDLYFAEKCTVPLNVIADIRNQIKQGMQQSPPTNTIFAAAQKEIYWLMRKDTYPKFLDSKDYKKALKDYQKRQNKEAKSAAKRATKSPKTSVSAVDTSQMNQTASSATTAPDVEEETSGPSPHHRKGTFRKLRGLFRAKTHRDDASQDADDAGAAERTSQSLHGRASQDKFQPANRSHTSLIVEERTGSRSRNLTPTYETDEEEGLANVSVLSQAGLDLPATQSSSQESGLGAPSAATGAMVVFRVRFPTQSTSVVETTAASRLDEALGPLMQRFRMAPATLQARKVDTNELLPWDHLCDSLQEAELEVKQADLLTVQFPDTSRSQLPVLVGHSLRQVLEASYQRRGLSFTANPPLVAADTDMTQVDLDLPATEFVDQDIRVLPSNDVVASQPQDGSLDVENLAIAADLINQAAEQASTVTATDRTSQISEQSSLDNVSFV